MPKLSYYYPNAYSRIKNANSNIRILPIGHRTYTDKQKTSNLGSIFPPNYSHCSYATTGYLCHISTKMCNKSFHPIKSYRFLYFIQKVICARFATSFKNSLPSVYILKEQPNNSTPPHQSQSLLARWETIVWFVILSFC